jgi:hypothetical protein
LLNKSCFGVVWFKKYWNTSSSIDSDEIWALSRQSIPQDDWQIKKEVFSNSNNYNDILNSPAAIKKKLANKNIVFVGDSVTRYQYLNLIQYLHSNSWLPGPKPSVELENEWGGWKSYHRGSNLRFGCLAICDCYRDQTFHSPKSFSKENRHYYDFNFNIKLSFYSWTPDERAMMGNAVNLY